MPIFKFIMISMLVIITICSLSFNAYAIRNEDVSNFNGDVSIIPDGQREGNSYIKFVENNSDNIDISKIYFYVKKDIERNDACITFCLKTDGKFLFDYKAEVNVDGRNYNLGRLSEDGALCSNEGYPIKSNEAKIELVIKRITQSNTPFPTILLYKIELNGASIKNDTGLEVLSANADRNTIRQFMERSGSTVTLTEGKNLPYIISLSANKKLELLDGDYQGPIEEINVNNVSLKGIPEATISGIVNNVVLWWSNSNNISISNLIFTDSSGGIFFENCSNSTLTNNLIKSFDEETGIIIKDSSNITIQGLCVRSDEMHSTGILLDNSRHCKIFNNSIEVRNALYYTQNNSINNYIYDMNSGLISDNGIKINETNGCFEHGNSCITKLISSFNNTWERGEHYICN